MQHRCLGVQCERLEGTAMLRPQLRLAWLVTAHTTVRKPLCGGSVLRGLKTSSVGFRAQCGSKRCGWLCGVFDLSHLAAVEFARRRGAREDRPFAQLWKGARKTFAHRH